MNASNVAMWAGPADVASYDPYSCRIHADPCPPYAWMREHAPLHRSDKRDFWALSCYDDVSSALRKPDLFSSRNGISLDLWGRRPRRPASCSLWTHLSTRRCAVWPEPSSSRSNPASAS